MPVLLWELVFASASPFSCLLFMCRSHPPYKMAGSRGKDHLEREQVQSLYMKITPRWSSPWCRIEGAKERRSAYLEPMTVMTGNGPKMSGSAGYGIMSEKNAGQEKQTCPDSGKETPEVFQVFQKRGRQHLPKHQKEHDHLQCGFRDHRCSLYLLLRQTELSCRRFIDEPRKIDNAHWDVDP